ncbi:MAG: hypothetical protein ACO1PI_05985 [Bacteroidota bacterium]
MAFPAFVNSLFAQGESVNTNTFEQNQALLTRFLQNAQNATIRVYVASGPGYGHQSNTVNIMWSLIAAGFNQAIQLIYDDAPTVPTTIQKLATLIPGLDPANPNPVTISGVTISFIALSAFTAGAPALVNFGITGGYDSSGDNLAKITNTTLFLKLQPYLWPQVNALYIRDAADQSTVIVDLSSVDALGQNVFSRQDYYLPLPAMSAADYVNFTASDPTKVTPYQAILAACAGANPAANMMPVYGIGDTNGAIQSLTGATPQDILFNLITSIAYNQTNSTVASLQKGAIIVVIATVTAPPYTALTNMINGAVTTTPTLNAFLTTLGLAGRVDIIDYDDPQFNHLLTQVQANANKILVIKMNGLPSKPFNYMYYKSTLPCVFEGKGTASLVLNLPVPFINLTSSTLRSKYVYPSLPLPNIKLMQPETAPNPVAVSCNNEVAFRMKESAATTETKLNAGGFPTTVINAARQFMENAYTTGNPTQTYFNSLSTYFHTIQNDKLLNAILYMLQCTNEL